MDAGGATLSPSAFYRNEYVGMIFGEIVLVFGGELDHAAGFVGIAKRGEDFSGDAEVGVAHVRALFGFGEGEGDLAEVFDGHGRPPAVREKLKPLRTRRDTKER